MTQEILGVSALSVLVENALNTIRLFETLYITTNFFKVLF